MHACSGLICSQIGNFLSDYAYKRCIGAKIIYGGRELLKVIIFNVERGFCAFVRSPNNYGLLVDCGSSSGFSPIKHIADNETQDLEKFNDRKLAYFIVSHPHDDHISDIRRLTNFYPALIYGRDYDWDEIKDPEHKFEYENLDIYSKWKAGLSTYEGSPIDWGMEIWENGLSVSEAKEINSDRQAFVNNSSVVLMLKYRGWKIFFPGDLETDGWEKLLERSDFQTAISGTDFFVTSHHGHKSGYSPQIYEVMGKPCINIVSEKRGEEVCDAYSEMEHAKGIEFGGQTRRMLTTRRDGSILIEIPDEGNPTVDLRNLQDNIS